jgi:uncharacterized LabA/DUF88 family protein
MDDTPRIALLIDADNVSVDIVGQVLKRLVASGDRLQHRRAYGSVQKCGEFGEFCREHAIRFLPSTFAGPNATDIALAIDAVEMMLSDPVDEVVIVSSDMDYSPLIVRLRELGARVTGYGQEGKSGRDVERDYERVYDHFTVMALDKSRTAAKAPVGRSKSTTRTRAEPAQRRTTGVVVPMPLPASSPAPALAQAPAAPPLPNPTPVAAPAAAPARRRRAAGKSAAAVAKAPALPAAVEAVLAACPDLRSGAPVRLNGVAKALREADLMKKSGKTTSLFKKLEPHFELIPPEKPESVRFIAA